MDDAHKDQYVTVDKKKYRDLIMERDRWKSEALYLKEELQKTEKRISDAMWRLYPDRMGR